jgi:hypothetical protein
MFSVKNIVDLGLNFHINNYIYTDSETLLRIKQRFDTAII